MILELPEKFEAALKMQANAHGLSPDAYLCEVLERDLAGSLDPDSTAIGLKSG